MYSETNPAPQGQVLPSPVKTGGIVSIPGQGMGMLPAAPDRCQLCAVEHEADEPHNKQSLPYQVLFAASFGRAASWADAMAHCHVHTQLAWTNSLREEYNETVPHEPEHEAKLKAYADENNFVYVQPAAARG